MNLSVGPQTLTRDEDHTKQRVSPSKEHAHETRSQSKATCALSLAVHCAASKIKCLLNQLAMTIRHHWSNPMRSLLDRFGTSLRIHMRGDHGETLSDSKCVYHKKLTTENRIEDLEESRASNLPPFSAPGVELPELVARVLALLYCQAWSF